PILFTEPSGLEICYNDNYYSSNFPSYYKDGEVKRIEVPFYLARTDPDDYFKPLDIVKIFMQYINKVGLINSARYQGIANSGQSEVMRDGIQMQAAIVTTPPNWYRLN